MTWFYLTMLTSNNMVGVHILNHASLNAHVYITIQDTFSQDQRFDKQRRKKKGESRRELPSLKACLFLQKIIGIKTLDGYDRLLQSALHSFPTTPQEKNKSFL